MAAMSKFKWVQLFFTCVISVAFGLECRPKGKCSCEMSDGSGTIDLTPLSNTNPPRFKGVKESTNPDFSFDYDPCKTFNNGQCNNVFVCQMYKDNVNQYNAGKIFGTKISGNNEVQFIYNDLPIAVRKTVVTLKCDDKVKEDKLSDFAELTKDSYTATLTSRYACPVKNSSSSKRHGISTGTVLCILLLVAVVIYLALGIVINKYARKKEGKELVPNASFWADFPSLVKDGCVFSFGKVRGKPSEYERI
ncbi:cation-dependent mannose-6-phosphate receptor-like [Rhopilema esculentum]|uniref:cation-dependent mannose-6-phosphate receptor-like n=1 Tax=Rhopilema esculentum TaxID=499914 RepID=UPI0031DDB5DC